jgi:hypothetical protein
MLHLFGYSRIFLLEILIFKGLTAPRLYKSFGVKGLNVTRRLFLGVIHLLYKKNVYENQ